MTWPKIRYVISIILFFVLAVFFTGTCLLGFWNYPTVRFVLMIIVVLIGLCVLWSGKPASDSYHPLKDYKAIIFLVLLTLVPRAVWLASVHTIQVSDFKLYYRLAELLAEGTIKFQSYIRLFPHVIAYPFILSIPFRLFGSTILTAQVFNLFLFVGTVLSIFLLAAQILDRRFAILAAVTVALWPSQLFYTTMVSTEALFTLLLVLCIGLFYSIRNLPLSPAGITLFGLLGVIVAITNAIRPFGLLFLSALLIYYLVFVAAKTSGIRPWIVKAGLFGFLCLGYFLASNFIHYLTVRTVQGTVAKTFLGYSILVGSNVDSGGRYNEADASLLDTVYQNGKVQPDEANRILLSYAIERIKSSPLGFISLQLPKNRTMWQDDRFGININKAYRDEENPGFLSLDFMEKITPVSNYYYYTILIGCILGSVMALRKREQGLIALVGLIILGTILIFAFTEVQERYHYHVLPLFALLAAYGLSELNQLVQHRKQLKAMNP
jgi:4-amino-4-deoxy-L-arabinose transferase-like glycosyltransferase